MPSEPTRRPLTRRQIDLAVAALLTIYALALWWPTRALPYHWDGAMFVARAARDLAARNFTPFVAHFTDFAHPPLFIAALALGLKVFGAPIAVGHALVAPSLPLLLIATYGAGARSFGRRAGLCAAAFTGSNAVVVAEYGQVYFDVWLAALCALGLWQWWSGRDWLAGTLFAIAAGIKIPALVFPTALAACALARRSWSRLPALALPFAVAGSWLFYQHAVEGFWFVRPGRMSHVPSDAGALATNAFAVGRELLGQRRFIPVVAGTAAALAAWWVRRCGWQPRTASPAADTSPNDGAAPALGAAAPDPGDASRRSELAHAALACTTVLSCGVVFFALAGEFGARYGIMLMPPLFLLSAAGLRALLARRRGALPLAAVLVCGLLAQSWSPAGHGGGRFNYRPDADLGYLDMIELGMMVGCYVESTHAGERIYGSWPEAYWLPYPELGYVARPIAVEPCRAYRPGQGRALIFAHLYSPDARTCWKLIHDTHAPPLRLFQQGGKWVQLHELP